MPQTTHLRIFLASAEPALWVLFMLTACAFLASCIGTGAANAEHAQAAADFAAALGDKVTAGALTLEELVKAGAIKPDEGAKVIDAMVTVRDIALSAKQLAEQAKLAAEGKASTTDVVTGAVSAAIAAYASVRAARGKPTPKSKTP